MTKNTAVMHQRQSAMLYW